MLNTISMGTTERGYPFIATTKTIIVNSSVEARNVAAVILSTSLIPT